MLLSLLTGDAATDAAMIVPPSLLLWALGIAVSIIGAFAAIVVALFKREVAKMDKVMERTDQRLIALEKALVDIATRPMLSSFGDRFEGHLRDLSDKLHEVDKELSERCAKIEGRKE